MKKDAYLQLLAPFIEDYRGRESDFWLPLISGDPIFCETTSPDGTECCVEFNAHWDDKPNADIRVIASIHNWGWRQFMPVTDSFIIAPDGTFIGE